ncbi:MAG: hypothetical protein FD164_1197 [Nitrospirae bacterium]|nr:MAG: hypothetical protein FD164_1197 [Nitrospirota bacterium]HSV26574.1 Arc family DNA-binding protein [Sedimentisphaerales bacterium]
MEVHEKCRTVTVKNIPAGLYDHLKKVARSNRRSISSEIIVCLERALNRRQSPVEEAVEQARQIRGMTS